MQKSCLPSKELAHLFGLEAMNVSHCDAGLGAIVSPLCRNWDRTCSIVQPSCSYIISETKINVVVQSINVLCRNHPCKEVLANGLMHLP